MNNSLKVSLRISLHCAGSYAVSELYNGIARAIELSSNKLVDTGADLHIMIRGVRAPIPPKPNILILTDEPYEVDKTCQFSRNYDLVFTNEKNTISRHPGSVYLPLAYDPILRPVKCRKEYDICHIGGGYPGRRDMILPVIRRFKNSVLIGPRWPKMGRVRKTLIKFDDHVEYYRRSRIVLNVHRNNSYSAFGRLNRKNHEATHLAPRVWTCGAIGTFQIIDSNRSMNGIGSLISAATPIELIHKCEYYLSNHEEREQIALEQMEEIKPHNWIKRLDFILNTARKRGLIQ